MKKIALNNRSKKLISNFLVGGAAAGGSAALASSLLNYIKMLKEEAAQKDENRIDDDTLYLTLGNTPKAANEDGVLGGVPNILGGGIAMTAGTLGALGSYALVRKMYQKLKKKRLQKQLDDAQTSFVDVMAPKEAAEGKPMGFWEMLGSSPVAFTLLSAIASGALTNQALNKAFPKVQNPQRLAPKKVILRKQNDPSYYDSIVDEDDNEEVMDKYSYEKRSSEDVYDDGLEFVINLVVMNKAASDSDLKDIVYAVANGRKNEVVENIMTHDFDTAMTLIKGASEVPTSVPNLILATSACVKEACLKPIMTLLAAAEYTEMAPHFVKAAQELSETQKETMQKIAGVLGALNRSFTFDSKLDDIYELEKSAALAEDEGLDDLLQRTLKETPKDMSLSPDSETSVEEMKETEDEGSTGDIKNKKLKKNIMNQHDVEDTVDSIMSVKTVPTNLV